MKTQEQIFEEVVTPNGGGTLREKVYQAIQLYSDQQSKEKDEKIAELEKKLEIIGWRNHEHYTGMIDLAKDVIASEAKIESLRKENEELRERIAVVLSDSALGVEIQRLTTENKELEEKLMSEQIENGYLQAFRVSNEAEIQRLREGVEELKNDLLDALDLKNGNGPTALTMLSNEITRLQELLGETLKWLQWSSHSDAQLLASKIDNALNHKP